MTEGPEQPALLDIEGSEKDGCAWMCSPAGDPNAWCHDLGPREKVAEKLSERLGSLDLAERL